MVRSEAERKVYLACRPIFTHQTALVRKPKKIRELVEQHKVSLSDSVADFGEQGLVQTLKALLDDRIFESDSKAKEEFPELFRSSAVRDVQRSESEIHAVRSVVEALEEIESQHSPRLSEPLMEAPDEIELSDQDETPLGDLNNPQGSNEFLGDERVAPAQPVVVPSLYPSYVPYAAQHIILTTSQRILEECCYDFFQRWKPSILETRDWECAEAIELTKWTRLLRKHSGKLPAHAFKLNDGSSLPDVLLSTNKLRHSAVHRLRTTARGVIQLIGHARDLAEALQDSARSAQLDELYLDAESKIKAMELNKNVLEDEFAQKLEEIIRKRKELDQEEEHLRAHINAKDLENKLLIGSLLEESVERIFKRSCESQITRKEEGEIPVVRNDVEELHGWGRYAKMLTRPSLDLPFRYVLRGEKAPVSREM